MWLIGVLLFLIILYLYAVMPRISGRPDRTPLYGIYYAHRGLHDNKTDAPENSMAAFRKAVEAGYGIELDVQLTKDRIPVVFHDETLKRVCGVEGKVRDFTYEELQQFTICKSQERIPLFADFLKMVDGRVPLIIEIKIHEKAAVVCAAADELIRQYKGIYCIESFDPRAVYWYRKNRPEAIRGQLSSNFNKPGRKELITEFLVHYLLLNFLARPDFIAYEHTHKKNISRRICCNLFRALSVAWTIKSQQQLDGARDAFELFIFEGFIPEEK
ncbi:MAG: glycerophosphodiester phosphodiesterase [Lachnospiraceae bacterium]|nr:glycerophosphodiester phosphodiesterase [Lachnospiraceae bacterium]